LKNNKKLQSKNIQSSLLLGDKISLVPIRNW